MKSFGLEETLSETHSSSPFWEEPDRFLLFMKSILGGYLSILSLHYLQCNNPTASLAIFPIAELALLINPVMIPSVCAEVSLANFFLPAHPVECF